MLSIIISTYQDNFLSALSDNIRNTIGVPFEIISIENKEAKGICEVYNIGVEKAQYEYLCFVHEDVLFHTDDWGKNVLRHFENPEISVLSIAGTTYFSQMPGGWWSSGLTYHNLLQSTKKNPEPIFETKGNTPYKRNQIVAFDGVFFCIKKTVFTKLRFDETTFKKFHFYDADISLQLHQNGYKMFCVYDILIQHFSLGDLNRTWINEALVFQNKWSSVLPISLLPISKQSQWNIELSVLYVFMQTLSKNGFKRKTKNLIAYKQISKLDNTLFFKEKIILKIKFLIKSFL